MRRSASAVEDRISMEIKNLNRKNADSRSGHKKLEADRPARHSRTETQGRRLGEERLKVVQSEQASLAQTTSSGICSIVRFC